MSRVYIAAPLPLIAEARRVSTELARSGVDVISTWHHGGPTVDSERALPPGIMGTIGDTCFAEITSADALLLIYGPPTERCGSILETGFALGLGRSVFVIGRSTDLTEPVLPTRLLHAPRVTHVRSVFEVEMTLRGMS